MVYTSMHKRKRVSFSPSSLARKEESARVAWPPGRCVPKWPRRKEPEEDDFDREWRERKNREDEAHCAGITLKSACGDSSRAGRKLLKWRRRFRERNEEREPTAAEEEADPAVREWKARAAQPGCKWTKRLDSFQYLGSSLNWPVVEKVGRDPAGNSAEWAEMEARIRRGELPAPTPFEGCRPPHPYLFYDTDRAQYRCSATPPNQAQMLAYLDNVLHVVDTTHPGAPARDHYQRYHGYVSTMIEAARLAAAEPAGAGAATGAERPAPPRHRSSDAGPPAKRSKKGGAPKRRRTRRTRRTRRRAKREHRRPRARGAGHRRTRR